MRMLLIIVGSWIAVLSSASTHFHIYAQDATSPGTRKATAVYPLDLASDKSGTVYIADRNLPGVWKYDGKAVSIFVSGSKRFREKMNTVRCVAVSPDGEVVAGDPSTREVYRISSDGTTTPLVSGIIGISMDLAFASNGTMYVADVERRVLWKLEKGAEKPVVFAEANPRGVFVDSSDRVWIVSQDEQQLQRFTPEGTRTVIVDKRVFDFPHQVVVDDTGAAWVTDGYKKGLWKVVEGQEPELTFSGEPLQNPVGIALCDGKLAIVDPHAQSVFRYEDGKMTTWFRIPIPPVQN